MENLSTMEAILIIIGVVAVLIISFLHSQKVLKKELCCRKCGKKFDYNKEVEWDVTNIRTTSNTTRATEKTSVSISCECANCGNVQGFTKEFVTGTAGEGYSSSNSVEDLIIKHFNKKIFFNKKQLK